MLEAAPVFFHGWPLLFAFVARIAILKKFHDLKPDSLRRRRPYYGFEKNIFKAVFGIRRH